jgi:V/A-type H+-transporting ATPase subunit E
MSDAEDISGLEAALSGRAQKMAEEHIASGHQARERILADTQLRLRVEEEREVFAAKARAERSYQQQVQAAELDLRGGIDRLRWELANASLAKLPARLIALTEDEARYLPLLRSYLQEGAQSIERDDLIAQFNARDLQRLKKDWERYAAEAAPGKRLALSPQPLDSIGGVLITSADHAIRCDNTFEGRMERLDETLQGAIAEWLMPQSGAMTNG